MATFCFTERDRMHVAFVLDNGSMYHIAHGTALAEYLLSLYLVPSWKSYSTISWIGALAFILYRNVAYDCMIGVALTICGQALRSSAMVQASTNFSHAVQYTKAEDHRLVTHGVYA